MSTKKEKCCECTSKERPSHVFRSSGTPGMKDGGYFTCNCPCHQTESIEWEKDLSFRFDTWLKLYPGTPTIGEIEEWWLESLRITIASAVEAERRIAFREGRKAEHKGCQIGCPYYQNNHSVGADGSCNLGCC